SYFSVSCPDRNFVNVIRGCIVSFRSKFNHYGNVDWPGYHGRLRSHADAIMGPAVGNAVIISCSGYPLRNDDERGISYSSTHFDQQPDDQFASLLVISVTILNGSVIDADEQ